MIVGEGSCVVAVSPAEVFEFVLDLKRYREADRKIGRVGAIERDGSTGLVTFWGRIRGVPGPKGVYPFSVTSTRLAVGSPVAGAARWFMDFEGTFECAEVPEGTLVTHREVFRFKAPWKWLAEPLLRRWLERDTAVEMQRFQHLVGRP